LGVLLPVCADGGVALAALPPTAIRIPGQLEELAGAPPASWFVIPLPR
jgi:hypothetical protein